MRKGTKMDKFLSFGFYLPLSLSWFFAIVITGLVTTYLLLRAICKKSDPTESEIEKIDQKSLN